MRRARRRDPLFVFLTSATVAGLLGHAALLASVHRPHRAEWKQSTSPELVRETSEGRLRLALNGER